LRNCGQIGKHVTARKPTMSAPVIMCDIVFEPS
jgi:hypothetical protein